MEAEEQIKWGAERQALLEEERTAHKSKWWDENSDTDIQSLNSSGRSSVDSSTNPLASDTSIKQRIMNWLNTNNPDNRDDSIRFD